MRISAASAVAEWRSVSNGTKLQALGDAVSALAVAAMVLEVVDNELYTQRDVANNVLRGFISGLCGAIILLLYKAYQFELLALKISNVVPKEETLWSTGMLRSFLLEAFICSWHTPPGVRWTMTARDCWGGYVQYNEAMLGLTVFGKLYLLARSFRDHHSICKGGGRFLCTMNSTEPSVVFVLKALLEKHPIVVLSSILMTNLVVASYALVLCERAYNPNYLYSDGLWNLYIALTTVGFGDVFPYTYPGRTVIAVSVFIGLCSTALLITVVQEGLRLTRPQARVLDTLGVASMRRQLRDAAAACMQRLWRLHVARRSGGRGGSSAALRRDLRNAVSDFKNVRRRWREFQEARGNAEGASDLVAINTKLHRVEEMLTELLKRTGGGGTEDGSPLFRIEPLQVQVSSSIELKRSSSELKTSSSEGPAPRHPAEVNF